MLATVSTSVTDMLHHAGASEAALRGQVHILCVDAIRDTVGGRWGRHQPLVEDFVLRAFARSASEDDFIVRVNDTDFLVIQPSRTPMGALSRSSQLLRETLNFFLGAAEAENVHISVVDRIGDDGLEATRVTEDEMTRAADERLRDLGQSRDGSPPWEKFGVARPTRKVVSIRRPDGEDIQAVFYLDPVWHIAKDAVVSFVARTIAVQKTPEGELEPVDTTALTPGASAALAIQRLTFVRELLGAAEPAVTPIVIHVPISMNCLSYSGSRSSVLREFRRLADDGRRERLIAELLDVPEALPQSRLSEAIAQIRPYVRGVLVRTPSLTTDVNAWARCGAVGVIHDVRVNQVVQEEKDMLALLPGFVGRVQAIGLSAGLYGVRSRSITIGAWSAGVTHLSGDYITDRLGHDPIAQRFSVLDLYRS